MNRVFRFRRTVEAINTFTAPRFVTTLVVFTATLLLLSVLI